MATPNRVEYLLLKNRLDDFVDASNVTSTLLQNRLKSLVEESNITMNGVVSSLRNISIGENRLMNMMTELQQRELSHEVEMVVGLVMMVILILVVLASLMASYQRKFFLWGRLECLYTRSFLFRLKLELDGCCSSWITCWIYSYIFACFVTSCIRVCARGNPLSALLFKRP